ncbi:tRNA 5-carboxymethoxyuridine methyltransferase [Cellvibrio zantedeschiae]|uniref:tRNA 5-carboxymethoxyuridine methyltransferase n=1 Tax=Cellvibrio zantedeschiae TaxID=1237077 RepID=A0ABQ3AXF9_9GAMM|nr:methyltransferase domain-containing protein [Cellvibrio zantedeschiae]GGY70442.1 tRNA 5-carboxymethoxyuridine methyltransferase [Cellvibrio zantedeschiae]
MAKQPINQDRNFDDLAKRFQKNIYGGLKGDIRLAVLERDFREYFSALPFGNEKPAKPLRILDAGGGQGQFSLQFAKAGHSVVICDISAEMLKLAEQEVMQQELESHVQLIHCAIQDVSQHIGVSEDKFDVVLCHAVMEWVANPAELLGYLLEQLKPQGYLSLTFYNLHSLIYKNLLRTNFKKIQQQDFGGSKGSLTPINPLYPEQVFEWLNQLPLQVLATSGIRVFHDYIFNEEHRERDPQSVIELELELSRKQPYQLLGRYIHVLGQKRS